jgi:hypothetical protein
MIETLSGPGRGRVYTHKGYRHQASAPGDPPALETGELSQSVGLTSHGDRGSVGTPLPKGLWLERGTRYIAPRPFVARSFRANRQHLMSILTQRWDAAGTGLSRGHIRTLLYRAGRLLGDLSSLSGGIEGISGIRSGLYTSGRVLGDIGAVQGGSVIGRGVRRTAGRQAQPITAGFGNRLGRRAAGRGAGIGMRQVLGGN